MKLKIRKQVAFIIMITFILGFVINTKVRDVAEASPGPEIVIDPPTSTANPGSEFTIKINIATVTNLYAWEVKLGWTATVLNLTSVTEGPFLKSQPEGTYFFVKRSEDIQPPLPEGFVIIACTTLGQYSGVSGSGTLATVTFLVETSGTSPLDLYDTFLVDSTAKPITHTAIDGDFQSGVPPDFSLSASPSSLTIVQGASGTSTITITSLNDFSAAVSLSVSGAPTGVTATLSPASVTPPAGGTATSTLTISVGASAATGTYTLTVTGTSGSLTHTATVSLTVTAPPDFSISASPTSLTIAQGSSGTSTITVTSLNGFTGTVSLSVSGAPTGVTATSSPTSVTLTSGGSATSTLTITVSASAATGTYTLTVTGSGGGKTHTATISLTVSAAPDFSISASPASLTIVQGASGTSTITVTSVNGFHSAVSFTISGLPSSVTATFVPTSVTPPEDGAATSTLTISVDTTAPPGTYPLTVTGTSGSLSHATSLSLTITAVVTPDFGISASPTSLSIVQGDSDTPIITISSLNGFNSPVSLTVSGAPVGVTTSFSVNPVTPPADGSATSTLSVSVSTSATPGSYTLTVTGASGALAHEVDISLTITALPAPDFSISAAPTSLTIVQGESDTSTITVTSINGFDSAVTLSVSGAPTGVTATFTASPITPPSGGTATSTLTINVGASTPTGTYTLTVTAKSGTISHTVDVSLTVTSAVATALLVDPPSVTAGVGETFTVNINIENVQDLYTWAFILRWDPAVLNVTGVVEGPFLVDYAPEGTFFFSKVYQEAGYIDVADTILGAYPGAEGNGTLLTVTFLVEKVGETTLDLKDTQLLNSQTPPGQISHVVNDGYFSNLPPPVPDFSMSASPSSLTIAQGGSDATTITVTSINGFYSPVTLSVSGVPTGVTTSFSANPVTPPSGGTATSTLTFNVDSSTAPGTYTLTVTGTYGTLTHSATISLMVTAAAIPDFSINASPTSLSIVQGSSVTSTITITSLNGFSSAVSLSISSVPTGTIAVFNPASVTPPSDGSATSALTINVGSSTATGTYTLTVTGTSGTLSHTVDVSLTVTAAVVHDIAVIQVTASPTTVEAGQTVSISATVENQGTQTELFNVIAYYDTTQIATVTDVSLAAGATTTITFTWDTTDVETGIYTIKAEASTVPGEIDTADNLYVDGTVTVQVRFEVTIDVETYVVLADSNSTISDFDFNQTENEMSFEVSGPSGTIGYLNVTVPKALFGTPPEQWTFLFDETPITPTMTQNATHVFLYFIYNHSVHTIRIIGGKVTEISATVNVTPDTLNLGSAGKWITVYIKLPQGYRVQDIDFASIKLNNTIPAVTDPKYGFVRNPWEYLTDSDGDGIPECMVKFERASVIEFIRDQGITSGWVTLSVTGQLANGIVFQGFDTLRVVKAKLTALMVYDVQPMAVLSPWSSFVFLVFSSFFVVFRYLGLIGSFMSKRLLITKLL